MNGVLVIDKPQGLTSHDVVAVARRSLNERRIGHTGTLDPLATGVLPLACGRATRLVRFFVASDKDYDATVRFGVSTDSYDITGIETGRTDRVPTCSEIEAALASLGGEHLQVPPAFSAKKVGGERAYEKARRNEQVTLLPVRVRVTRAELLEFSGSSARIGLTCSTGFYVRSFVHSLGELVGTGACLETLRRTRSGEFTIQQAVNLTDLHRSSAAVMGQWIPLEGLLRQFLSARLTEEGRKRVARGQTVGRSHVLAGTENALTSGSGAWIRLLDESGQFVALGTVDSSSEFLHPAIVLI
jgi:tRNA pseudouridine55 synthase